LPKPDEVDRGPGRVPSTAAYASGKPKFNGFLSDGEMYGAWEWFRLDGSLLRTGQFDQGRQIGPWRTFDRSGRLVKETNFGE
jgi:antitoxin component YwqK of YwqJK toxin-antitoxin module